MQTPLKKRLTEYHLPLFLIALLTMLISTKSSPLYPLNDWVDSNAFFTMGKAMFNGKVLYRDVFDHKGPILHFLHGIGWLISHNSFFGVWLLEIIACYIFLLLSYRTLVLFTNKRALLVMPFYAVLVYTTRAFCHGDSAEEFCLPLILFATYTVTKSLKNQTEISPKNLFLLGITSAGILWTKYTMLGFYIGWIIVPLFLAVKAKNWRYIGRIIQFIGAGVALVSAVVLSYFLINNALFDLWDTYFYGNIFEYATESTLSTSAMSQFPSIVLKAMLENKAIWLCILLGCVWLLIKRHFSILIQIALMVCAGLFFTYFKAYENSFPYYAFSFSGFAVFGFLPAYSILSKAASKLSQKRYVVNLIIGCMLILPATYKLSQNSYLLLCPKADMPQFQFAEIINQKEDATLLNYGFMDGGFYTASGVVPNVKHFCPMALSFEEAKAEHIACVANGSVDFVVTRNTKLHSDLYEECCTASFPFEGFNFEYTLYERKTED